MKKALFLFSFFLIGHFGYAQQTIELTNWKFKTGDNFDWAKPGYKDSSWKTIQVGKNWEAQGYTGYDGYAWYRITFNLPSSLRENVLFKDSILFSLGKIDDRDQTFLNGKLIGQNAESIPAGTNSPLKDLSGLETAWNINRYYTLSSTDPRLKWNKENVLAIRVYDGGGDGGMYTIPVNIRMKGLNDYLVFDSNTPELETKPDGTLSNTIRLINRSSLPELKGTLILEITDLDSKQVLAKQFKNVDLKKNEASFTVNFKGDRSQRIKASYTFVESKTNTKVIHTREFSYILTPKEAETPKINGAKVVGVHPGFPFLFRIPATGIRPMTFAVENLPEGLSLDSDKGVISGNIKQRGEYLIKLKALNAKGEITRNLKIVVGDRIALTPPMGWNSWNCFGLTVTEEKVKTTADIFIKTGIANHGWTYINIDDGWESPQRDAQGEIVPNGKFKDMKALTGYIHSYGLKAGLYSSPGPLTCGQFTGSYQHEESDARSYADWGFDYLKYDWCSYDQIAKDGSLSELQKPYKKMKSALEKVNRDILFSLCQYGNGNVWKWGGSVGGNTWRTTGDIMPNWESMSKIGFNQEAAAPYAKPGNWNDPDMLVVGWVGFGNPHPTELTPNEQYTHISLWSLLSAPLLIGCDLTRLDDFTLNLLTNDEVIDIDQDPLGKQATPVLKTADYQIMVKELEDGSKAVGLFNLTENDLKIPVTRAALQLSGNQTVRDVWRQKDLGIFKDKFESVVPPHGVTLVKVSKQLDK